MDIDNLGPDIKFLFFTIIQAALKTRSMGKNKDDFIEFCKGIWESMELNDEEELRSTLFNGMIHDLKEFVKDE